MNRTTEIKVGVAFLLAIILVGVTTWYILGYRGFGESYSFDIILLNAQGLQEGDPVRMSGVTIGQVERVSLTSGHLARVTVLVDKRYELYDNYRFTLSAGGLIPERHLDVVPEAPPTTGERRPVKEGAVVRGVDSPGLPDLIAQAEQVFVQLRRTAKAVEVVVGNKEILSAVNLALANFAKAAEETSNLASSISGAAEEAGPRIEATLADVRGVAADLRETTGRVSNWAKRTRAPEEMEGAIVALRGTAERVEAMAESLEGMLTSPQVRSDFESTVANIRRSSENVQKATENINEATKDVKQTTEEIKKASPRITRVVEKAETVATTMQRLQPPEVEPSFDVLFASEAPHSIASARVDLRSRSGRGRFLRLGVDDIGEESGAIAQFGDPGRRGVFRYGLYRKELGIGWDRPFYRGSRLSLDLFDPNNLRLDVLTEVPLSKRMEEWSLVLGVRDLFEDERLFLGARMTR